jgi:tRNA modification GTPase
MLRELVGREVKPRQASLAGFMGADGVPLDQGLVLFFPAPHSYTGEDVIELHGHGGPIVLQLVLRRCLELGARPAEPGEFTKRAYLNDRIDLAQAESVADLIDASTVRAARSAMRSLSGDFSQRIEALSASLIELRALVEAHLDFPEEELDGVSLQGLEGQIGRIQSVVMDALAASRQGSLLREGIRVVLAGPPNVGKSSLMNRLAGREVAIVTDVPGTTRDLIKETINLRGVPLHLTDTAGLRAPSDAVEKIGIFKAQGAISDADLVLWVSAVPEAADAYEDCLATMPLGVKCLKVVNKIDLVDARHARQWDDALPVSAKTGEGIERLGQSILDAVGFEGDGEDLVMARTRHVEALRRSSVHLHQAKAYLSELELCAEELKLAQRELASITGEYTPDDLLGVIFSKFCIGK